MSINKCKVGGIVLKSQEYVVIHIIRKRWRLCWMSIVMISISLSVLRV